ncbi:hypothetical protein [Streptomyces sp. NPDC059906]|uniref:hypothetical protein n=1 Tax=Streptomyces sp. NPDC059906 TaxID=3346997 RepID=UPI00364D3C0C
MKRIRRMAMAVGTAGAAVTLVLGVTTSATAAEGTLVINGQTHKDPSGCYPIDRYPSSVANHTDAIAEVHRGPGCTGQVEWLVHPGEIYRTELAQSVFIL